MTDSAQFSLLRNLEGFLLFLVFRACQPKQQRGTDANRAVRSESDADRHGKGEGMNALAAEEIQDDGHEQRGQRGQNRSGQRLVDRIVNHRVGQNRTFAFILTDAVEQDDRERVLLQGVPTFFGDLRPVPLSCRNDAGV